MAQAIDQILQELDAGYNPQRQAINDRINQLQPQVDAQVQGIKQDQATAYRDINRSAQDRGMFFSSIPSSEQSDYTQKTYVPALAQVAAANTATKNSLYDNLNNINLDQRKTAYGIRDSQLTREQVDAQAAASLKASQAQQASYGSLFNQQQAPAAAPQAKADPVLQLAHDDVATRIQQVQSGQHSAGWIKSDYQATLASAQRGNQKDKYKIELYHQLYPEMFSQNVPATILANGNQLKF